MPIHFPFISSLEKFSFGEYQYDHDIDQKAKKLNNEMKSFINFNFVKELLDKENFEKSFHKFKSFFGEVDELWVLGTGGSTLGAQALVSSVGTACVFDEEPTKSIVFWDNIDPKVLINHVQKSHWTKNHQKIGVLAISKSGHTTETLAQLHFLLSFFPQKEPLKIMVITEENDHDDGLNPLREIAQSHGFPIIHHPKNVGGRFSALSVVGLMPLGFKYNLSLDELLVLRQEAWNTANYLVSGENSFLIDQILQLNHLFSIGKRQHIMMIYGDKSFGAWWAQLVAESLGKTKNRTCFGFTPIVAVGTLDQHSQLQLYLDGPKDKIFTMVHINNIMIESSSFATYKNPINNALCQTSLSSLLQYHYDATCTTLTSKNINIRCLRIEQSIQHMATMMMYYFFETIGLGFFWQIDPFDQPAVEHGKILVNDFLIKNLQK